MKVCIVTSTKKIGRVKVSDIFWGVFNSESVARAVVLKRGYKDGAIVDLESDGWKFQDQEIENLEGTYTVFLVESSGAVVEVRKEELFVMTKKELYLLSVSLSGGVLKKYFNAPDQGFKDMESNQPRKAARKHVYDVLASLLLPPISIPVPVPVIEEKK